MVITGFRVANISRIPGSDIVTVVDVDFLISNNKVVVSGASIDSKFDASVIEKCIENAKENLKYIGTKDGLVDIVKLGISNEVRASKERVITWCEEENEDMNKFLNEPPTEKEQKEISSLLSALGMTDISILDGNWTRVESIALKEFLTSKSKVLE